MRELIYLRICYLSGGVIDSLENPMESLDTLHCEMHVIAEVHASLVETPCSDQLFQWDFQFYHILKS